jgi:hypothetical protein
LHLREKKALFKAKIMVFREENFDFFDDFFKIRFFKEFIKIAKTGV